MSESVRKVLIGAGLAAAGAVAGYVTDAAAGGAFGVYSVAVAAVVSVGLNALRKWAVGGEATAGGSPVR